MTFIVPSQDLESLNTLVAVKEQEWRSLLQQQISTLKNELVEKDKQINLQKVRFNRLKEDFEYNLDLLSKRDNELGEYDLIFEKLRESISLKDGESNETRLKMDFLEEKLRLTIKENETNQEFYKKRITVLQEEINILNEKNDIEILKEQLQWEEVKNVFHKQISELQEDFKMQKTRLFHENESKLCQQKKDHQIILDGKETKLLENQLKVKMLGIELEFLQNSSSSARDQAAADQEKLLKLEKLLSQKIKEVESVNLIKDIQLRELEAKVEEFIQSSKIKRIEIKKKYNDLLNHCASQDAFVETLKNSNSSQEEIFKEKLKLYKEQGEVLSSQLKQTHLKYITNEKTLETKLHSAHQEIEHLKFMLQHLQDIQSQNTVTKDVDFAALRLLENNLKYELDSCQIDLKKSKKELLRSKQELEFSLEREKTLKENNISEKKSKVLIENKLNEILENHKSTIKKFEDKQEKLNAVIQKSEEELLHKESVIQKLKAVDISSVESQNQQLKLVIKEMRAEMVLLSEQMNATPNETYIQSLEAEIASLKSANRDLKNKLQDHATSLGVLQNENTELSTLLKTKDSTITCLKNGINTFENERKQLMIAMEGVCFDSAFQIQNSYNKITVKKNQITDQTQPESDQYTHGCNLDTTHFNSRLSNLPAVFGPEKQQPDYTKVCPNQQCSCLEFCKYRLKLKLAVERIKDLLIERSKMINNSNRLRANLKSLQENIDGYHASVNCSETNRQKQDVLHNSPDFQKQATLEASVDLKVSNVHTSLPKSYILESLENHKNQNVLGNRDLTALNKEIQDSVSETYKENLNPIINTLISSSSDSSLKEIWKLLDMGESFSTVESKQEAVFTVLGKPVLVEQKILSKRNFIAPKVCVKKKFARNYNDKNDNNFSI